MKYHSLSSVAKNPGKSLNASQGKSGLRCRNVGQLGFCGRGVFVFEGGVFISVGGIFVVGSVYSFGGVFVYGVFV